MAEKKRKNGVGDRMKPHPKETIAEEVATAASLEAPPPDEPTNLPLVRRGSKRQRRSVRAQQLLHLATEEAEEDVTTNCSNGNSRSTSITSRLAPPSSQEESALASQEDHNSSLFSSRGDITRDASSSLLLAPATRLDGGGSSSNEEPTTTSTTMTTPDPKRLQRQTSGSRTSSTSTASSLFGTVMKNVQQHDKTATTTTTITDAAASSIPTAPMMSTPQGAARLADPLSRRDEEPDDDDADHEVVARDGGSSLFGNNNSRAPANNTTSATLAASPGGFQLRNFLDQVESSPFHVDKRKRGGIPTDGQLNEASLAAAPVVSSTRNATDSRLLPDEETDWHETVFDDPATTNTGCCVLPLIDWSLKKRLRFEVQASSSVELSSSRNFQQQQFGLHQFVTSAARLSRLPPSLSSSEWQAGLLYWQYPSGGGSGSVSPMNIKNNNDLVYSDLLDPPRASGWARSSSKSASSALLFNNNMSRSVGNNITSTTNHGPVDSYQKRQWEQAFESLYHQWVYEIQQLNKMLDEDSCHAGTTSESVQQRLQQQAMDTYFYACGSGHVVLFCVGLRRNKSPAQPDEVESTTFVPEIRVSSSDLRTRQRLRTMGVKLSLVENSIQTVGKENLAKEDGDDELDDFREESLRVSWSVSSPSLDQQQDSDPAVDEKQVADSKKAATSESPGVKKELAALRRAQVMGQTAGADVSISMKPRRTRVGDRTGSLRPDMVPPLRITGIDDCAAFVEVYLNTLGQISGTSADKLSVGAPTSLDAPLPRLLCRKLGPFLHSSLQKCRVATTIAHTTQESVNGDNAVSKVDVHGLLLPCAVRDLISATVHYMLKHDGFAVTSASNLVARAYAADDNQKEQYQGEQHGVVGIASSSWFNGGNRVDGLWSRQEEAGEEDRDGCSLASIRRSSMSCEHGEVLSKVVWDSSRRTALGYKLDYVDSGLL